MMVSKGEGPATKKRIAGLDATVIKLPGSTRRSCFGRKGDVFLFTSDEATMETALRGTGSLADAAAFNSIRGAIGGAGASVLVHYNHRRLMSMIGPRLPFIARPILDMLGFNGLVSVDLQLTPQGAGYKCACMMSFTERTGVFDVGGGPLRPEFLETAPRNSLAVTAATVDLKRIWAMILKAVPAPPPQAGAAPGPNPVIAMLEARLGFSIENDLLASFGKEFMLIVGPGGGPLAAPSVTVVAELGDARAFERLEAAVERLMRGSTAAAQAPNAQARPRAGPKKGSAASAQAAQEPAGGFKRMDFQGKTIRYFRIPSAKIPIVPAFTVTDKHIIFGTSPQTVKGYLMFLSAGGPDITTSPDFQAVRPKVLRDPELLGYVDTKSVFMQVYSMIPLALGFMGSDGMEIMGALPPPTLFDKYLFGSIFALKSGPKVIRFEAYSPTGLQELTVGAPLVAGLMLPAVARARGEAKKVQCRTNLRQIGLAMSMYSVDHRGKGPKTLQELYTGGYLSHKGNRVIWCPSSKRKQLGRATNYVLRKEIADGSMTLEAARAEPIVWDDPVERTHGDAINVLYGDGSVTSVNISQVAPSPTPGAKQWPALVSALKAGYGR